MFKHRDLARKCQLHEVLHKITGKKIPKIKVIRHLFGKKKNSSQHNTTETQH